MKNTKLKVLVVTLAVCLLAMGSLGTLAWFTAEDEVTNKFLIADSDDDADGIFSIDVWEDATSEDTSDEEKIQDGIEFKDIQPDDNRYKEVNIENTGYYDQYVRATVTITGADVWFEVFEKVFFDLENFATDLNSDFVVDRTEVNFDTNEIIYTLYYNNILKSGEVVNLFTNVNISYKLNQEQAAKLAENRFNINVKAEAVQTANVGDNAIEAFKTVGMYNEAGDHIVITHNDSVTKAIKAIEPEDENVDGFGLLNDLPVDVTFDFTEKYTDQGDTLKALYVENLGTLEVIGGAAKVGTATDYGFITRGADAETVINGTEITSNGGGIAAADGANVIFNDGSLIMPANTTNPRYIFYVVGGSEVVINDGEFDFTVKTLRRAYIYADAGSTVTINGGTFGTASTKSGYTAGILGSGTVVIKGGTFGFDPSAWVAEGYEAVKNDATWTVVAE